MENIKSVNSRKTAQQEYSSRGDRLEPVIKGWWQFDQKSNKHIPDLSGNGRDLFPTGDSKLISAAIKLDGETQWLSTKKAVFHTNESFSIVAWVRLDSDALNGKLLLKPGENALTAISQDSSTHCGFYLGVRRFDKIEPEGHTRSVLNWCFTLAPFDMKNSGVHARSVSILDDSILDKWVMLVGVCDVVERTARLYLPIQDESGIAYMPDPDSWILWNAEGPLQIGRGQWEKKVVDQWPGSIGPVRVFSGVLKEEDVKRLYHKDLQTTEMVQV